MSSLTGGFYDSFNRVRTDGEFQLYSVFLSFPPQNSQTATMQSLWLHLTIVPFLFIFSRSPSRLLLLQSSPKIINKIQNWMTLRSTCSSRPSIQRITKKGLKSAKKNGRNHARFESHFSIFGAKLYLHVRRRNIAARRIKKPVFIFERQSDAMAEKPQKWIKRGRESKKKFSTTTIITWVELVEQQILWV